jgi:hypothetical protein
MRGLFNKIFFNIVYIFDVIKRFNTLIKDVSSSHKVIISVRFIVYIFDVMKRFNKGYSKMCLLHI